MLLLSVFSPLLDSFVHSAWLLLLLDSVVGFALPLAVASPWLLSRPAAAAVVAAAGTPPWFVGRVRAVVPAVLAVCPVALAALQLFQAAQLFEAPVAVGVAAQVLEAAVALGVSGAVLVEAAAVSLAARQRLAAPAPS